MLGKKTENEVGRFLSKLFMNFDGFDDPVFFIKRREFEFVAKTLLRSRLKVFGLHHKPKKI